MISPAQRPLFIQSLTKTKSVSNGDSSITNVAKIDSSAPPNNSKPSELSFFNKSLNSSNKASTNLENGSDKKDQHATQTDTRKDSLSSQDDKETESFAVDSQNKSSLVGKLL